jgi:hypothetical protein
MGLDPTWDLLPLEGLAAEGVVSSFLDLLSQ